MHLKIAEGHQFLPSLYLVSHSVASLQCDFDISSMKRVYFSPPLGWAWPPDLLWSMGILACIMQSGSKKNVLDHWGLPFLVAHENPVTITKWMSPGFPAWWEQCIDHLFSANTWMNPADTTMRKEKQSQQRASQIADSQNHKHTKKWLLF